MSQSQAFSAYKPRAINPTGRRALHVQSECQSNSFSSRRASDQVDVSKVLRPTVKVARTHSLIEQSDGFQSRLLFTRC